MKITLPNRVSMLSKAMLALTLGVTVPLIGIAVAQSQYNQDILHPFTISLVDARSHLSQTLLFSGLFSVLTSILSWRYLHQSIVEKLETVTTRCEARLNGQRPPNEFGVTDELAELDTVLAHAQDQWVKLIHRDCSLFENLAVEAERKTISADINQQILPHFDRIAALADQSQDELLTLEIKERMQGIASGVGGIMSELHARLLDEAGLIPSITTLVDRFKRASLIETTIAADLASEDIDISLEAKFAVYRVTQEALNNIEKHSGATRARVTVRQIQNRLIVVCIEDNGTGFHERRSTQSRGLKNIRERAASVGARVIWEKSRSFKTGTLVTIALQNRSTETSAQRALTTETQIKRLG